MVKKLSDATAVNVAGTIRMHRLPSLYLQTAYIQQTETGYGSDVTKIMWVWRSVLFSTPTNKIISIVSSLLDRKRMEWH